MSLKNDDLLSNVKRQAKRLSKKLSIPLGQAQEFLSIIVYGCESWTYLRTSLKSESFDNQFLVLAALYPKADIFLFKLLNNNMSNIITRFKEKFPEYDDHEKVKKLIINLFGIELHDFERKMK